MGIARLLSPKINPNFLWRWLLHAYTTNQSYKEILK